jgi:tetratricopeptide (TPR) repeat protein
MLGQLDAALDDFHQAIAINPNFVWALVNRGHVFRLKGQYQRALADFDRAISLDPNNAWAMAGRAQVNRALQRYDQAQTDIGRAIALTPELDADLFRRAITEQLKGDVEAARADLDEAIGIAESVYEIDPENWRNTFSLALYYLARGRRTLSERLYREALSAPAPSAEIHRAQRTLEDYLALFPDNNVARAMLEMIDDYQRG